MNTLVTTSIICVAIMLLISRIIPKKPKALITAVRLRGIIGTGKTAQLSFETTHKQIHAAFEDKKAKAVALLINSPGGSPAQSHEIYTYIRENAEKHKKPVYAFIEDVGASGGYYIACAADHIYASPTSIVGSIGVISSGFGLKGLIEKLGIERRVHTQGKNKCILDPFADEKGEDVEVLKSIQKDCHEEFINIVKESRKDKITQTNADSEIFTGLFWLGRKAKELGLVDEIGTHSKSLKAIFGEDVEIKYIKEKKSLMEAVQDLTSTKAAAEGAIDTAFAHMKMELAMNRFNL